VGPGQLEGREAAEGAPERGVLSHPITQSERSSGIGKMEIESIRVDFEPVEKPAEKPGRRRPENSKPIELDIA
jgi:hypothetical protein